MDRADLPWPDLQAAQEAYESGRTVVFDKSPSDYPQPRYDALGRPAARSRGRSTNGLR